MIAGILVGHLLCLYFVAQTMFRDTWFPVRLARIGKKIHREDESLSQKR